MSNRPIRVGSVAYDPRVVTIWEGFREYFREAGVPTDYVLFSNYEAQVQALFDKEIEIAWNTNVAFVRCEQRAKGRCQVLGMRNTDVGFTSRLLTRTGMDVRALSQLRGKRVAVGTPDSGQATILPLYFMREAGLDPQHDLTLLQFDLDLGKHGDTGTSELEVLKALHSGAADAGFVGHVTWLKESELGHVNGNLVRSAWVSPPYSHCIFTALPEFDQELGRRWSSALLQMEHRNPRWRHLMDLEGLTAWVPGSKEGYGLVARALKSA